MVDKSSNAGQQQINNALNTLSDFARLAQLTHHRQVIMLGGTYEEPRRALWANGVVELTEYLAEHFNSIVSMAGYEELSRRATVAHGLQQAGGDWVRQREVVINALAGDVPELAADLTHDRVTFDGHISNRAAHADINAVIGNVRYHSISQLLKGATALRTYFTLLPESAHHDRIDLMTDVVRDIRAQQGPAPDFTIPVVVANAPYEAVLQLRLATKANQLWERALDLAEGGTHTAGALASDLGILTVHDQNCAIDLASPKAALARELALVSNAINNHIFGPAAVATIQELSREGLRLPMGQTQFNLPILRQHGEAQTNHVADVAKGFEHAALAALPKPGYRFI